MIYSKENFKMCKMKMKRFDSSDKNVFKYVFKNEDIITEAVLYRYGSFEKRTVICCSVQSGCPVGCTFCGTGENFLKNLTPDQIIDQITEVLKDQEIEDINSRCGKFQIMFMSMGEPFLNYDSVHQALIRLNEMYPNAQLLISTVGISNEQAFKKFAQLSADCDKIGLQFSIHKSIDIERDQLIPFKSKWNLREIRDHANAWTRMTNRNVYLNYCIDGKINSAIDVENLKQLFSSTMFNFTFSVVCSADETMKDCGFNNLGIIREFENLFIQDGYNTRIFDPAGQDDIGGGCGQLWYTQEFLKNSEEK